MPIGQLPALALSRSMLGQGPLKGLQGARGKAGGYGYDKFSAAIESALRAGGFLVKYQDGAKGLEVVVSDTNSDGKTAIEVCPVHGGAGDQEKQFESAGYTYCRVIG